MSRPVKSRKTSTESPFFRSFGSKRIRPPCSTRNRRSVPSGGTTAATGRVNFNFEKTGLKETSLAETRLKLQTNEMTSKNVFFIMEVKCRLKTSSRKAYGCQMQRRVLKETWYPVPSPLLDDRIRTVQKLRLDGRSGHLALHI